MLDVAVELATKEAAGQRLSLAERAVSDIMWVDTQVSANGFDGWLYNTPNERITRTLEALDRLGCSRVADIARRALAAAGVDSQSMSDDAREERLDSLSDEDRDRLSEVDGEFYDAVEECMEICRAFVDAHKAGFGA
jgi:hypothetical protein